MSRSEILDWLDIKGFKGAEAPNAPPQDPTLTRDMVNMHIEEGKLVPRPGAATFQNADHDEEVTRFLDYNHLGTIHLLRFSLTGIQEWSGSAWADLTIGTAFTAVAGDNADAAMFKDNLYVIPQPGVKPSKWTAAAGTVTQIAAAVTARTLAPYSAYLLLGYANADPRGIRYSNDGATWSATDVLTMEDTPGFIMRISPFGGRAFVYKNTSVDFLKFVGSSTTTFGQDVLTEDVGLGAFNTLAGVSNLGQLFLGSDARLYLNNGTLQPILKRLSDRIRAEINISAIGEAFGSVDPSKSTYTLFYPVASDSYSFRRMDINYLHGTAVLDNYENLGSGLFIRGAYTTYGSVAPFFIMSDSSSAPKTYRLDTTTQLTDAGSNITRYWTTDWLPTRGREIGEVQMTVKHKGRGVLKVLVADELGTVYDLLGTHTLKLDTKSVNLDIDNLADRIAGEDILSITEVNTRGDHVKFRIEFEPKTNHDDVDLRQFSIGFVKQEE